MGRRKRIDLETHLTRLIRREVGWFNGWSATWKAEEESCRDAAKKCIRYMRKRLNAEDAEGGSR